MKRLTKRDFVFSSHYVASKLQSWSIAQSLKKLQEYENAEEDGRLLILPVKISVGDRLYHYWRDEERKPHMISERVVEVGTRGVWVSGENNGDDAEYCYSWKVIGKTRFLSPEDAKL